jgi:hypothetical protein
LPNPASLSHSGGKTGRYKDRGQPAGFYMHVKRNAEFDDWAEVLKAAPECFRIENGTQTVGRKPSQLKRAAGQMLPWLSFSASETVSKRKLR